MTHWRITLRKLREVLELLKMVKIEFYKMRRRPFILIATLAALILPAPISLLTAKTGQGYDFLYKSVINLGQLVLLIPVLCIVATMLFYDERDNNTLKSLRIVPVSMKLLVSSKLIMLLILSIFYSVFAFVTTVIFSMIGHMDVEHFWFKFILCIITGVMVWVASLPSIAIITILNRNYIFSVLFSFLYAIMGFIITNATIRTPVPNLFLILPVNVINRWLLPFFQQLNTAGYPFEIAPCSISTVFCVIYLLVYTGLFGWIICNSFKKWDN